VGFRLPVSTQVGRVRSEVKVGPDGPVGRVGGEYVSRFEAPSCPNLDRTLETYRRPARRLAN